MLGVKTSLSRPRPKIGPSTSQDHDLSLKNSRTPSLSTKLPISYRLPYLHAGTHVRRPGFILRSNRWRVYYC